MLCLRKCGISINILFAVVDLLYVYLGVWCVCGVCVCVCVCVVCVWCVCVCVYMCMNVLSLLCYGRFPLLACTLASVLFILHFLSSFDATCICVLERV